MAYSKEPPPNEPMFAENGAMSAAWRAYYDRNLVQNFTQVETDIANTVTKTEDAAGNLASYSADGDIADSGISIVAPCFSLEVLDSIAEASDVAAVEVSGITGTWVTNLNASFVTQAEEINALKAVVNTLLQALIAGNYMDAS